MWRRSFSSTLPKREILDAESLPDRIIPKYQGVCFCCALPPRQAPLTINRQPDKRFTRPNMALTSPECPHNQEKWSTVGNGVRN